MKGDAVTCGNEDTISRDKVKQGNLILNAMLNPVIFFNVNSTFSESTANLVSVSKFQIDGYLALLQSLSNTWRTSISPGHILFL